MEKGRRWLEGKIGVEGMEKVIERGRILVGVKDV